MVRRVEYVEEPRRSGWTARENSEFGSIRRPNACSENIVSLVRASNSLLRRLFVLGIVNHDRGRPVVDTELLQDLYKGCQRYREIEGNDTSWDLTCGRSKADSLRFGSIVFLSNSCVRRSISWMTGKRSSVYVSKSDDGERPLMTRASFQPRLNYAKVQSRPREDIR